MDAATEYLAALKGALPANAFRMRQVLDYIATHPGASMTEVRQACEVYKGPYRGVDSIHRLLWRGMVYDLGRCNRARLYVTLAYAAERPAGSYDPGHP